MINRSNFLESLLFYSFVNIFLLISLKFSDNISSLICTSYKEFDKLCESLSYANNAIEYIVSIDVVRATNLSNKIVGCY